MQDLNQENDQTEAIFNEEVSVKEKVSNKTKLMLVLSLFILLAFAAYGFFVFQTNNEMGTESEDHSHPHETEMSFEQQLSIEDNETDAVAEYDKRIAEEEMYVYRKGLEIARAYALFSSEQQVDKKAAIDVLREIVNDPIATDLLKAYGVNAMLDLYYIDRSPMTMSYIRTGDNLYKISEEDTNKQAAQILSEFSTSVSPTSAGYRFEAFWYANEILDNPNLTVLENEKYIEKIVDLTRKSINLFSEEVHKDEITERALLYHFSGFLSGSVSTSDSDEGSEFETYFKKVLELAEQHPEKRQIKSIAAYTRFYYAAFLDRVYGTQRTEDVLEQTQQLSHILQSNLSGTSNEAGKFIDFLQYELSKPESERDHNYEFIESLVEVDSEFADVVETLKVSS